MATATYHKRKLYVPKEVERKLGLADGDQAEIRIIDDRSFTVTVRRKSSPEERIARRTIERPFTLTLKRSLKREDYYED